MKTSEEGRLLSEEIAELLKRATKEQKLIVKGMLIAANEMSNKFKQKAV